MLWQPLLPDHYAQMSDEDLAAAIVARKAELGSDVVILGHHYQQDEVIQFADFTGDSFKLSQLAAEQVQKTGAKYILFCGVHFMAESADILTPDDTTVILPDLSAGCSMADMADYDQTVDAWDALEKTLARTHTRIIPICYMNCTAAIKYFCGTHGGAVCTSSNCDKVFAWAMAGGDEPLKKGERVKILFVPDQHLGRNTAADAGFDPVTQMVVWDPNAENNLGGNTEQAIDDAVLLLWKGHCSVHQLFKPEHVDQSREMWPDATVIVHPECSYEVCQKADLTGSTERIKQAIETAEPGSRWAVGTEIHMVNRLAGEATKRGVEVKMLSGCQCMCSTMYRIDMPHLLWVMDHLAEGKVINEIKVHQDVQQGALVALQRMLDINASPRVERPASV